MGSTEELVVLFKKKLISRGEEGAETVEQVIFQSPVIVSGLRVAGVEDVEWEQRLKVYGKDLCTLQSGRMADLYSSGYIVVPKNNYQQVKLEPTLTDLVVLRGVYKQITLELGSHRTSREPHLSCEPLSVCNY
eukprot:TRINITY_DN141563_c0_g1_i1.p2 TRINITY_DN141563_c0_g1~~TRINITY_DN141563_c0_g1_i1.p2  ORF type:complete len:133 (-),score=14.37 TRINITY_DN141563_c0_g1_i1:9-407(-)